MSLPSLTTVTVERRGYGRRYSDLPVDQRDLEGFLIDCTGTLMRPIHYDLRPGDIVRWRDGERIIEGLIAGVERSEQSVQVRLVDVHLLPPEFFLY